ncbi:MAG: YggT family protein [Alphaproteobacteria bacterium]|nr:YggT family protein [Alphaproteobacteria bacterium]
MSVLAVFLNALIVPVALLLHYYILVIIAAVILSWLEAFNVLNTYNRFVSAVCTVIHKLTDPYFNLFRKIVPPAGGLDFSPLIGLFVLYFLQNFIPQLLAILASKAA